MERLELSGDEQRTLREMGIFHPHPETRMRAQRILRSSQGLTLQQTADEFTCIEQRRAMAAALEQTWPGRIVRATP